MLVNTKKPIRFKINIGVNSLVALFLFFCVFPYVSFINLGTDNQPYVLVLGLLISLILPLRYGKINIYFLALIIPFLFSIIMGIFSEVNSDSLRSIYGYATIFIVALASFFSARMISAKFVFYVMAIWLLVGLIQLFFLPNFANFLVPRSSTSISRGVTSLAVEPAYFAYMQAFLMLLYDLVCDKDNYMGKNRIIRDLLFIISILITKSSSGVIILVFYYFSLLLTRANIISSLSIFLISLSAYFVNLNYRDFIISYLSRIDNNRAANMMLKFMKDGFSNVISADDSASDRLTHILVPIYAFYANYGLPYGYGKWIELVDYFRVDSERIFNVNLFPTENTRIMSGFGQGVFELGFIGTIPILVLLGSGFKAYLSTGEKRYIAIILVWLFMYFQAVPLSYPTQWLILGIIIYKSSKTSKKKL